MKENIYTDGSYLEKNPDWGEEDSLWKSIFVKKIIERNKLNPRLICDIGCGRGLIIKHLCDSLHKDIYFDGFDISIDAIHYAKPNETNRVKYYLGDIEDIINFKKNYDLAIVLDVVEHLDDYTGFLKKVKNVATYKLFHLPIEISIRHILFEKSFLLKYQQKYGHINHFSKLIFLDILKEYNHNIIDYFYPERIDNIKSKTIRSLLFPIKLFNIITKDLSSKILGSNGLLVLTK